ncbi:aspartyl-phosphate phosphatase Spo0E family protein [Neobacillus sp. DY30]|uniref:aspartyl-phosphate phosphatase Spo0E family protein n=1 Tax=Neobacillus sp. DY30 TaxID=3047871 RepID=UPI0024C0E2C0|nr:aspartyl-phosphate phosphatase Spo0E family protein [Neobacillus sp. DY30]WHX99806.1 aspartyl-phosphate phosphatase Spo0E family protein [Neobacillus sp. DY30]
METSMNYLLSDIEKTRTEMIDLARQFGYSNPNVVQCSQRLDLLLNVYENRQLRH